MAILTAEKEKEHSNLRSTGSVGCSGKGYENEKGFSCAYQRPHASGS